MSEQEHIEQEKVEPQTEGEPNQPNSEEGSGNENTIDEKDAKIQQLENELQKSKEEVQSLKDSWLRERADFQNYKKRTASEFIAIKRNVVTDFVTKLMNSLDNLDRVGIGVEVTEGLKPFMDGIEMIRKEFYSVLERENIKKYSPTGEAFDHKSMEAIMSEESDEYSEEKVIEVYQAGYIFQENEEMQVLRPARVKVGKPKS
ncbi:MAG: nucleotide exchange factor GrpE [Leptospiraceae bacterium]|nr:nucleotide exchange factor GrpE [Leptospiraceae bacterium]